MKRLIGALAMLAIVCGFANSAHAGGIFPQFISSGQQNTYQDQSVEAYYDTNNNKILDVGDVIYGIVRLDTKLTPVAAALTNRVYVAFSIQFSQITKTVIGVNNQYSVRFGPTAAGLPVSLNALTVGPGTAGTPAPAGSLLGLFSIANGANWTDQIASDPSAANSTVEGAPGTAWPQPGQVNQNALPQPAGLTLRDFTTELSLKGNLDFWAGLSQANPNAGAPADFFSAQSAVFNPALGDPFDPTIAAGVGAGQFLINGSAGISVVNAFAAGLSVLFNADPEASYAKAVVANDPVFGGAGVYQLAVTNGNGTGADPRGSPAGFDPALIDNAKLVINATIVLPEPSSLVLLGMGVVTLGGYWRRSRRIA